MDKANVQRVIRLCDQNTATGENIATLAMAIIELMDNAVDKELYGKVKKLEEAVRIQEERIAQLEAQLAQRATTESS
jgi:hypothetical protein